MTLTIVAVIGAATALFAGTIGLVQNDIKRVLAYSTVSQLGYMFLAMGVGAFGAGIFHLYTHAFFKACLFLGSGAVIHALHGEQDIRKMGGLKKHIPITYWTFVIASVAIAGVPFLSGFFSKDEILFETFVAGPSDAVGDGRAHVAADRHLHVPPGAPDVPRRGAFRRSTCMTAHAGTRHRTLAHGTGAPCAPVRMGGHLHDAPWPMATALDRAGARLDPRRLRRHSARARRPHGLARVAHARVQRDQLRPAGHDRCARRHGDRGVHAGRRAGSRRARRRSSSR